MASTNRTVYKNDWQKEHTDRISLTVPKGRKEELQEHAQQQGESLNAFINRAINETLKHDEQTDFIKKYIKDNNLSVSVEKAQETVELTISVKNIDSKFPGFQDLYDPGQLPQMIAYMTKFRR